MDDTIDEKVLKRRLREGSALAALTRALYETKSVEETLDVAVKRLSEVFPGYVSVNLVEEDGRFLVVKAQNVESRWLRFSEKLIKRRFEDWKIPLYEDTVIARTMSTGHPTVYGLDFEPEEPVVKADIKTMLEAMVERKNPLRSFASAIAKRVGPQSLLGIPFSKSSGEITGSVTVVSPLPFSKDDFNLIKVAANIIGQAIEYQTLITALRKSEERYRTLQENLPVGVFRTTPGGNLLSTNPAMLKMLGYESAEEFKPVPIDDVYLDPRSREELVKRLQKEGAVADFVVQLKRKNGSVFWASMNAKALMDDKGDIMYYDGIIVDITDRKATEEALRESEERYREFTEEALVGVYIFGSEDRFLYVNPVMEEIFGYSREELLKVRPWDLVLPEDMEGVILERERARQRGQEVPPTYELRIQRKNGEVATLEIKAHQIVYGGKPAFLGHCIDVSDRKQHELRRRVRAELLDRLREAKTIEDCLQMGCEAIRQAGLFKRAIFTLKNEKGETTHLGQIGLDAELIEKLKSNPPATPQMFKQIFKSEFRISHSYFVPSEAGVDFKQTRRYIIQEEESGEGEDAWKKGDELFVSMLSMDGSTESYLSVDTPFNGKRPDRNTILYLEDIVDTVARQIHEIKNLNAVRESEERYRAFTEKALVGVYIYGSNDKFVYVNPAMETITGYKAEELLGMNPWSLVLPEDMEGALKERDQAKLKGENVPPSYEMRIRRKDGEIAVLEVEATSITYEGKPAQLGHCIDATERVKAEEKAEHLNVVLRAIRNVNQLITHENNRESLIKGVCSKLVETRGYYSAWVVIVDEFQEVVSTAEAGMGKEFLLMAQQIQDGQLPYCIKEGFSRKGIHVIEDTGAKCGECPMLKSNQEKKIMVSRLEYAGRLYGLLAVSLPIEIKASEEERDLFREVSEDVAFAIHSIELEEKRRRSEEALQQEHRAFRIIAQAAVHGTDVSDLCHRVLKGLAESLEFDAGTIRLFDKRTRLLKLEAVFGLTEEEKVAAAPPQPIDSRDYVAALTARSRQPIIAPDVTKEESLQPFQSRLETFSERSLISWPLEGSHGDTLGVLHLWSRSTVDISEGDRAFFERIAVMFASVLERKRIEEDRDKHRQELQAVFNNVDILLWSIREEEDGDLYYEQVNMAFAAVEGYTPEHYNGKSIKEVHSPEECERIMHSFEWAQTGRPHINEVHFGEGANQKHFIMRLIPLFDVDGQIRRFIVAGIDITERKRAEEDTRERLFYEEAIASCSKILVEEVVLEEAVQKVSAELLSVAKVSRVYLFRNFDSPERGICAEEIYEKVADGVKSRVESANLRSIVYKDLSEEFWNKLSNGRPYGGSVNELPVQDRKVIMAGDVRSILILPIRVENQLWGFIGFDDCSTDRRWKHVDIQLLSTVSSMIGTVIARRMVEGELERHTRAMEGMYDLSKQINRTVNLEELLERCSVILDDNPGVLAGAIYLLDGRSDSMNLSKSFGKALEFFEDKRRLSLQTQEVKSLIDVHGAVTLDELAKKFQKSGGLSGRVVGVAMRAGSEVLGVFYMVLKEVDDQTMAFLEMVGSELGTGIKHKQAEKALRESEERYRVLTQEAMVGIYIYREGHFLFVNPAMAEITQYSREELLEISTGKLVVEEDFPMLKSREEARKRGEDITNQYEMRIKRKNGEIGTIEIRTRPVIYQGEVAYLGNCTDITEIRKVQKELEKSEERYRILTEEAMVGIYLVTDRRFMFVNPAMERITGYPIDELLNIDIDSIVLREDREAIARRKRHRKPGQPDQYTMRIVRKDGQMAVLEVRTRPITYGEDASYLGNCVDITELTRKREQIEHAKKAWESTFDSISDLVMILDTSHHIMRANRAVAEYTGFEFPELIDKHYLKVFHLEDRSDREDIPVPFTGSKCPERFEVVDPKTNKVFSVSVSPILDPLGDSVATVHVAHDITPMRNIEKALAESEAQFRGLAESAKDIIFNLDLDGTIRYINPAVREIFGYAPAEFVGKTLTGTVEYGYTTSKSLEFLYKVLQFNKDNERESLFETEVEDTKGRKHVLEISARSLPGQIVGIARDVTERNRMQQQLIQASKLASIGVLAAGIAHQVNNPLAIMLASSSLLRSLMIGSEDIPEDVQTEASRYLDTMEEQVERTNRVVSGLLEFTKPKSTKVSPSEVNSIVTEALELLSQHLSFKDVSIETSLEENLPLAFLDTVALQQSLVNVIQNSLEAMEGHGSLTIKTEKTNRETIRIVVSDTGPGVPVELKEEIFEPLFTTKSSKKGTGLGLAVSQMLLERFGGRIYLDDTKGGGATFIIEVPVRKEEDDV